MGDHRTSLYVGAPLSGGASLRGPRGLPCRYSCRELFRAPGMAGSLAILRAVAAARDTHEQAAHGAVYRMGPLDTSSPARDRQRAAHAAGGRARWARKGRAL